MSRSCERAERMRIGVVASRRSRRTMVIPSRSGRPRSRRTMSGRPASQASRASAPVAASVTRYPWAARSRLTARRMSASSSTTRMAALRPWSAMSGRRVPHRPGGVRAREPGGTASAGTASGCGGATGRSMSTARPPELAAPRVDVPVHRLCQATHDGQADAGAATRALAAARARGRTSRRGAAWPRRARPVRRPRRSAAPGCRRPWPRPPS